MIEQTCQRCGRLFLVKASEVVRRGGKYCSRFCYHDSTRTSPARALLDHTGEPTATGCLLWTGSLNKTGYGILHATIPGSRRHAMFAHRFAWEFARGPIPTGMSVLHRCDAHYPAGDRTYRRCVNPVHLFLGTNTENRADCVAKGRHVKGERSSLSKLTADAVKAIRARVADGETKVKIAAEYGISITNVYAIVNRHSWKHV